VPRRATGGAERSRLFRALLRAFPRRFRDTYGDEMEALFAARRARERALGRWSAARLWLRTIVDMTSNAAAVRAGVRQDLDGIDAEAAAGWPRSGAHSREGDGTMLGWLQDTRYAARRLARSPFFTVAAVVILAVGIGANTAAFSLVDAALFRPPPFERPEEVVFIYQDTDDGEPGSSAYPAYRDIAARTDLFAGVAATSPESRFGGTILETPDGPRSVAVEFTTSSYFPVLGLRPSRGTWFSSDQDFVGAGSFAVVSHRTWRNTMAGAEDVIGSTVRLNGQPVTIIGVGPEDFNGAGGVLVTDFWLSISTTPISGPFRVDNLDRREDHWYDIVARLKPGVSVEQARAAMDALAIQMGEANPELDRGRGLTVYGQGEVRLRPEIDGPAFSVGVVILAIVGAVLLLACSNLANMLLLRGVSRAPEMAVRLALGAGRDRLARLFFLEAILLSALGAGAGVLLARWAVGAFPSLPLPLPAGVDFDVVIDGRVLAFTALLAAASAVFFGLLPAVRASSTDVASAMREEVRTATAARRGGTLRKVFVGIQVAVSLVLLVGSGLLVRSFTKLTAVDPGVDVERLALIGLDATRGGAPAADAAALMDQLIARIEALPEVTSAALSTRAPVLAGGSTTTVVEGYDPPSGTDAVEMPFAYVSPTYFETMGIDLTGGRTFGPDDRRDTPRVVLVNEAAAQRFWGGDAIGKRVRPQGNATAWREVVGVVATTTVSNLDEAPTPMMYYSTSQAVIGCCYIFVRTDGDPAALIPALRNVLRETAPQLSASQLGVFEEHLGRALAIPLTTTMLMGAFSLLALALATLGVYAVVSFAVARRSAELGIRIALGAARSRLVAMVVAESLVTVALGVAVGLGIAFLAMPRLEGVLYDVGAADPLTFVGGALLLLLVGAVAAWIPAVRASRGNPVEVLRAQ
jgi:predicted permease